MRLTYDSVDDLEQALRRAAEAHGRHEAATGVADEEWPVWYALHMQEQQGGPGPEPDA